MGIYGSYDAFYITGIPPTCSMRKYFTVLVVFLVKWMDRYTWFKCPKL